MARNRFMKVRVTEAEATRWTEAAGAAGRVTLSAWLRGLAELAAAGGADPAAVRGELAAIRADLARGIGNNLNQIAHRLNGGRGVAEGELAATLCDVAALRDRITATLAAITPKRGSG